MPKQIFTNKVKTGWIKLDGIFETFQNAINERTPKASIDIDIDEQPDGMEISLSESASPGGALGDTAGGGGGASINLYGARDGAPAVFHLLQSSAPTAP